MSCPKIESVSAGERKFDTRLLRCQRRQQSLLKYRRAPITAIQVRRRAKYMRFLSHQHMVLSFRKPSSTKRLNCMLDVVILPASDAFGIVQKALNPPSKALLGDHYLSVQNPLQFLRCSTKSRISI